MVLSRTFILTYAQLDASLVDLAPSAYDMIISSLPLPMNSQQPASSEEQLDQLLSPASAKVAWRSAVHVNAKSPPLFPRAQGKLPQRAPSESFVLLQDSVIRNIPSPVPSSTHSRKFSSVRSAATKSAQPEPPTELDHPNPSPLSHHLRSTQLLLNLLSSRTDIDHPLCSECTHILLTTLTRQLEETKKERDGYIAFEKEVRKEKEREKDGMSKEEAERKIAQLNEDEQLAIEQLREAEREQKQLQVEMKALELEEEALGDEEEELVSVPLSLALCTYKTMNRFWRIHNVHLLKSTEQSSQLSALRAAYAADSATLERLERTNVYNDAFCIGHDGVFGTINGLRLGRVPGVPVGDSTVLPDGYSYNYRSNGPK